MSLLSLFLYFGFVVLAVVGLIILQRRLGFADVPPLQRDQAEAFWLTKHPDTRIEEAYRPLNGWLFRIQNEKIGLVRMMGRFPVGRLLDPADIREAVMDDGVIRLKLYDYTEPRLELTPDAETPFPDWVIERLLVKKGQ